MVKSKDYEGHFGLIRNPFSVKTCEGVRLSPDKDPRVYKQEGNTTYVSEYHGQNGNKYLVNKIDPKLTYCFGDKEEKELISINYMDMEVPPEVLNKTSKVEHKDGLPLSFLQIQSEAEGIEWYKLNYPKIPDDLYPIIARYHWGEPLTKKAIRNEKKKIQRKGNKGLERRKGNFKLSFD
jgi:hypothetical protein